MKRKSVKGAPLSPKQKLFWSIIRCNSGVLHLTGRPGISKTSQIEQLAEKLDYKYIDLRLSMLDETEVGLYPYRKNINGIETLSYAVPEWAILANQGPTIVNFDEIKRASLAVRNAALQILLERRIGPYFKFNDNVHFVITDNLGLRDGTDVDRLDNALNNRLVHIEFELTYGEWYEDFAKENVSPFITKFLKINTEYFYHISNKNDEVAAFATPRSWTFLSDWIKTNYPEIKDKKQFINDLGKVAPAYIGTASIKFIDWLSNEKELTINDIFSAKSETEIEIMLSEYNRDKKSELFKKIIDLGDDLWKRKESELRNFIHFISKCDIDETISFILKCITLSYNNNNVGKKSKFLALTLKESYPDYFKQIKESSNAISSVKNQG
jgi:hypothetical protein